MAAPPQQRQWIVEPPDDAGVEWLTDALPELNSFISAVTYGLTQQLSRADNFRSQKKVLKLNTANANFPLTFDCTLGATPEQIRVAQALVLTTGGSFSGPVTCANWELLEGAKIRVHDITGLAANTEYQITLIVE